MKRATALRYSIEIARRVHAVNGLLGTPLCDFEFVRIKRIWIFGSTAKGSQEPNDLDVLIDFVECGRHRTWRQTKVDKRYFHNYGIKFAPDSSYECLKWLSKGMKMVSRHNLRNEGAAIDFKKLIYPRYDMDRT